MPFRNVPHSSIPWLVTLAKKKFIEIINELIETDNRCMGIPLELALYRLVRGRLLSLHGPVRPAGTRRRGRVRMAQGRLCPILQSEPSALPHGLPHFVVPAEASG